MNTYIVLTAVLLNIISTVLCANGIPQLTNRRIGRIASDSDLDRSSSLDSKAMVYPKRRYNNFQPQDNVLQDTFIQDKAYPQPNEYAYGAAQRKTMASDLLGKSDVFAGLLQTFNRIFSTVMDWVINNIPMFNFLKELKGKSPIEVMIAVAEKVVTQLMELFKNVSPVGKMLNMFSKEN